MVANENAGNNQFMSTFTQEESHSNGFVIEKTFDKTKKLKNDSKPLAVKQFEIRESLLTELFKISHIRSMKSFLASFVILTLIHTISLDLYSHGGIRLELDLLFVLFNGLFFTMFCTWLPMQLTSLFVAFGMLNFWKATRKTCNSTNLHDKKYLLAYVTFLCTFMLAPLAVVIQVGFACRVLILMEQVRMLMKMHAYVYHHVSNLLTDEQASEKNDSDQPKQSDKLEFNKYLYYMFAPTLIYSDSYPRLEKTDWSLVMLYFGEAFFTCWCAYIMTTINLLPTFYSVNLHKEISVTQILRLIPMTFFSSSVILASLFYFLLHCWHNAWAEILRFGDRLFYTDWWNSCSYQEYFRTWNCLVQDWIHIYMYVALNKVIPKKHRTLTKFSVILISAIFHEYIFTMTFGFYYPVLLFSFSGLGFAFFFLPSKKNMTWNIFMLTSLVLGTAIQVALISAEHYARAGSHCPKKSEIFDLILPRSLLCLMF